MIKIKNLKLKSINLRQLTALVFGVLISATLVATPIVRALSSAEIQERAQLEQNIKNQEAQKHVLSVQASSIGEAIDKLRAQIATLENQITDSQNQIAALQIEINEAQAELDRQRVVLGENIRASYLEGQITTLEMLASSKDLSDFVDKQQYRSSVQDKIRDTLDKITDLKHQLSAQKDDVERYLKDQQKARDEIATQKAEQDRLLGLNVDQQNALTAQIKEDSARVEALNRKQVEENMRLLGGSIPRGIPGGGGYKYGNAICLWPGSADPPCRQYDWGYPHASSPRNLYDEWGYGYRNCTSWGAFRVSQVIGHTPPGLTFLGHAKNWPSNTTADVDHNPRGGDATVGISNGTYGHVRFIEHVYDDGSIMVSDYNLGGDGIYREYILSAAKASTLTYIHFQ